MNGRRWALALELENHDTIIVTSSEQVDLRMRCYDPETIVFSLERLDRSALVQVPDADCLVLAN